MRITALVVALPLVLQAQTAENRLDVKQLVHEALTRNPRVLAAQKRYEAARQRPAQERALPDPMVSVGWNSTGNPLPFSGVGTQPVAHAGIMASQELPAPGKLLLRAEIASKDAEAEAQTFRAAQLTVISQAKQAYIRLQHAWAMQEVLEHNRDLLRTLLHATEARYSVGKAGQADVFKAQTQITVIETRLLQVERERRTSEAEINALITKPGNAPVAHPSEPHMEPLAFSADDLVQKAAISAPMLARDQKMIERASSALNLAKKDYYPDITLNGGYFYMGSMPPMYTFRADVKLPLHGARIRAEVNERSLEIAEAKHAYEATAQSLEYRIRDQYIAAQTAQKLIELYSGVVIPQARLAVDSSLASYQTGGTDFLSVFTNELAAIDYELNYHEQMQAYHLALARLEEISGVELLL